MKKHYLGVSAKKEPREKGKHAKAISVSEVTDIAYKEQLSQSEYESTLTDGFNAWLLEAYQQHRKSTTLCCAQN